MKFRRNLGGPSPKAKYSLVTDSEPVREGKVKSTPEGSEMRPETVCLQVVQTPLMGDGVPL